MPPMSTAIAPVSCSAGLDDPHAGKRVEGRERAGRLPCVERQKVDGFHQRPAPNPQSDGDGQGRQVVTLGDRRTLRSDGADRIGDAHACAHEPFELFREARAGGSYRP